MLLAEFVKPLAGGILIGLSAAILLFFNGRIAGISGITRGLFTKDRQQLAERFVFLLGLVVGAGVYGDWSGQLPQPRESFPPLLLAISGLLVGTGTSLARGCTSGHGVCGLARLSKRSFIAVGVFLSTAIVTTYIIRHIWQIA
jgi:uncharacterized membrane protein YedE/YeeE